MYFGWMFAYMMSILYCLYTMYCLRIALWLWKYFRKIPVKNSIETAKNNENKNLFRLNILMAEKREKECDTITKWSVFGEEFFFLKTKKKCSYLYIHVGLDPHRNVSHEKKSFLVENMFQAMQYNDLFILIFVCFYFLFDK